MRTALRWTAIFGLVVSCTPRAAADDARAVVDRAVQATAGSADRLAKRRVCVQTSRGTLSLPTGMVPATRECRQNFPDQVRWAGEYGLPGARATFVIALDGLKAWITTQGSTQDLPQGQYEALRDETYFLWVATLVPLSESTFTLTAIPDVMVNGQPARGVAVAKRGRDPVQLYFDKSSGLLVKGAFKLRELGAELTREVYFSDPKDFEGLKLPTRQVTFQAGRKIEEWATDQYRFPDRLEPNTFARPK